MLKNIVLILCFVVGPLGATEKAVFGIDNRLDDYQIENSLYKRLAASTAAMIDRERLKYFPGIVGLGAHYRVYGETLLDTSVTISFFMGGNVCSDVPYSNQLAAATCSGFLVGPDLLVTAGHCVNSSDSCENNAWVFDFAVNEKNAGKEMTSMRLAKKNVFYCKEIVEKRFSAPTPIYANDMPTEAWGGYGGYRPAPIDYDYSTDYDYALIRLDRPVKGRESLTFRTKEQIETGTHLVVIGHPLGLPRKLTDGGHVINNDYPNTFYANLDAFHGNSGSPVFDAKTGMVEGILVTGGQAWRHNSFRSCYEIDNSPLLSDDISFLTGITRITELGEMIEENWR